MTFTNKVQYYRNRVLEYCDEFGFPLRRRGLLFYERSTTDKGPIQPSYGDIGVIRPVTSEEFRSFHWLGKPIIPQSAATWKGMGKRLALAAIRHNTLDGFCWIERDWADIRFFDMQCFLPPDVAYVSRLWIYPPMRGQGIGRLLLEFAVAYTQQLGLPHVIAACVPENARVTHLFEDLGWRYYQRADYLRAGPVLRFSLRPVHGETAHIFSTRKAAASMCRDFTPPLRPSESHGECSGPDR